MRMYKKHPRSYTMANFDVWNKARYDVIFGMA
jgi:hypothetical protein